MKYLVLGSAGQIGLSLCAYLRGQEHTVQEFDIADGMKYDLRRLYNSSFRQALYHADFVYFLAWDVGGSTYLARYQDTYEFIMNNVAIMHNVFDCLHEAKKPFVFASSQMANMSYSSYGLTKSLAEKLTQSLGGVTVKFWNVYGIEHDPAKTHVVTDFINKARYTRLIDMRTDGTELRQMLYADDCSEALYTLSQIYSDLPRDKEYHITSFEWHSMQQVAEIIAGHYPGTKIQPALAKDTVQQDRRNEPDLWIRQYWQPKTSLEQGIERIIQEMEKSQ
jgi:nucleoside-diphosphate-sugar epimerase